MHNKNQYIDAIQNIRKYVSTDQLVLVLFILYSSQEFQEFQIPLKNFKSHKQMVNESDQPKNLRIYFHLLRIYLQRLLEATVHFIFWTIFPFQESL